MNSHSDAARSDAGSLAAAVFAFRVHMTLALAKPVVAVGIALVLAALSAVVLVVVARGGRRLLARRRAHRT